MATLLLTTLGTLAGGPLGGAAGAVLGNQLDRTIGRGVQRQGARLQDLMATTSAYGQPVPRHFGQVRAPGTIIWATELAEQRETHGGGKGQPSVAAYSYAASFAVALASRPIAGLGRVWADGQLLRGAAGDLKVAGSLRLYHGYGDQQPDPLIAADIGTACPAFRGIAYCVFEGLHLATYGNRIPALTFEILAGDGAVSLAELVKPAGPGVRSAAVLPGLAGWSDAGDSLAEQLEEIGALYPLLYRQSGNGLEIAGSMERETAVMLPEAAAGDDEAGGEMLLSPGQQRAGGARTTQAGIRYYDLDRNHQIGTQLTGGRTDDFALLDFGGTMRSADARLLATRLRQRAEAGVDLATWRMAELDPDVTPGAIVQLPDRRGYWIVESWELDASGVVVELSSLPPAGARHMRADPGAVLPQADLSHPPTILAALELPPSTPDQQVQQIHVAASAEAAGWKGAALYQEQDGNLLPAGAARGPRSIVGHTATMLPPSASVLLERDSVVEVTIPADLSLSSVAPDELATGANRVLIGAEVLQYVSAERLGAGRWRLTGLLRGRGGTYPAARGGHQAGARFVLLDATLTPIDMRQVSAGGVLQVAAIGLADAEPVLAPVANQGGSIRPLPPVHVRRSDAVDGGVRFRWTERISGAWSWPDVPPAGMPTRWQIGVGAAEMPLAGWFVDGAMLDLDAGTLAELRRLHGGRPLFVRQVQGEMLSHPVQLMIL